MPERRQNAQVVLLHELRLQIIPEDNLQSVFLGPVEDHCVFAGGDDTKGRDDASLEEIQLVQRAKMDQGEAVISEKNCTPPSKFESVTFCGDEAPRTPKDGAELSKQHPGEAEKRTSIRD